MNRAIAVQVVSDALIAQPVENRADFLREVLAHAAGGLIALEGGERAAEAVYRVADAIIRRPVG